MESDWSYPFSKVLSDELQAFDPEEANASTGSIDKAHEARLAGLAFSGGGIRSATFNLGVLQALADLQLLQRFHYLSTVSGGGYIGSWLAAWIHRRGLKEVNAGLCTAWAEQQDHRAPQEIFFLRRFSNYLTPKLGWLGADTWTVIAIYVRNVLLNMAALIAGLVCVLLIPRLIGWLTGNLPTSGPWAVSVAVPLLVLILFAWFWVSANIGFFGKAQSVGCNENKPPLRFTQTGVQRLIVLPIIMAGWLSVVVPPLALQEDLPGWLAWFPRVELYLLWVPAVVMVVASGIRGILGWSEKGKVFRTLDVLCSFLIGFEVASAVLIFLHSHIPLTPDRAHLWERLVWLPPGFVVAFLLGVVAYLGLRGRYFRPNDRSPEIKDCSDAIREWWSRLGAWLLIYALAWLALFALAFYSSPLFSWLAAQARYTLPTLGFAWVTTTLASLFVARSPASGRGGKSSWLDGLVCVGPYVFMVGVFVLVACGIDAFLRVPPRSSSPLENHAQSSTNVGVTVDGPEVRHLAFDFNAPNHPVESLGETLRQHWEELNEAHFSQWTSPQNKNERMLLLLGGAFLIIAVLGARVDLNEFSMHTMYRDRLARCYLGAAHQRERRQHPFTGFDPDDDIDLASFCPPNLDGDKASPVPGSWCKEIAGPYPIINCSLNLVGGDELAWQERKAASFVFTPRYCGYEFENLPPGYCRTSSGGTPTVNYAGSKRPMTLATAMAISGAAVSPNMGYHSSPAAAFLMTLFNVRLGWWIGNPRSGKGWLRSSPSWAFGHLVMEMFGLTNAGGEYIYLSDGGHFENLGIFELVRRRCRFIIACDAEEDGEFGFSGLGNAIEKCRTDLGVSIELDVDEIRRRDEQGHSQWHCAVGSIRYDQTDPGAHAGTILYLKSSLTGDEPTDVQRYAARSPAFPHESTNDQWFGESQFESYRTLGHHVALSAFHPVREPENLKGLTTERIFVDLAQRWYPASTPVDPAFKRRGETLNALYETLRTDPGLHFLGQQIYSGWRGLVANLEDPPPLSSPPGPWLPRKYDELRAGFYFCNRLILLMEDVYHDLHLEQEHSHPDNRGWMNLFRHWAWSRMFRTTWTVSAANCGARFQNFCARHLDLQVGRMNLAEEDLGALLNAKSQSADSSLTYVEWQLLKVFFGKYPLRSETQLILIQLFPGQSTEESSAATKEKEPAFIAGFALLRKPTRGEEGRQIIYLRVRDHMRRMGMARRAIYKLLAEDESIGLDLKPMPEDALQQEDFASETRFRDIFRGVRVELEQKKTLPEKI